MTLGASASPQACSASPHLVRPRSLRPGSAWFRVACWAPVLLAVACVEDDEPLEDGATGGRDSAVQGATSDAGVGGSTAQAGSVGLGTSGMGGAISRPGSTGGTTSTGGSGQGTGGTGQGTGGNMGMLPTDEGETGVFVGMTAAHNLARQQEMQDPPLPALTWSEEIAEFSQVWADELATQCGTLMHRDQDRYGENLATAGVRGASSFFSPEEAVDSWMSEKACWSYGTIRGTETCNQTCTGALFSTGCGHYTQIIWRDTRRVGCGYSTCQRSDGFDFDIWVCNYDPPGNYIGETPY